MDPPQFDPAWWLRSPHLQTLWPTLLRPGAGLPLRRERLSLPDGDFVDLDWAPGGNGPIVLLLHGLEGSSRSPYAGGMLAALRRRGWRGVVVNFRGCSGEPNLLARSYHSGDTGDLRAVLELLTRREPDTPLAIVGFSLGGNVLLKWLGETGAGAGVAAAVAVSVPFSLADAAASMERGFSRLYQWWLLRSLRRSLHRKREVRGHCPAPPDRLRRLRTFRTFDEHVTAPLHGFAGADDYYARASSRGYLRDIARPTLVVHAQDDPFMSPAAIPDQAELPPAVRLEVHRRGGHVGFVEGGWPGRPRYWLERRIPDFLAEHLPAPRSAACPG